MDFDRQTIRQSDTIRSAMVQIDRARVKLCLVLDEAGQVIRSISDGDIRRALMGGADLSTQVSYFPPKAPVSQPVGTDPTTLLKVMAEHRIDAVVLIDADKKPVGLVARADLDTVLLSPPHIGAEERDLVTEAFDTNWVAPAGPHLSAFEEDLKQAAGRAHALALSSGTAALHLAMRVLGVRRQDRVYVSDLTFVASVQPILYEGAVPVLIDAEPLSWNMSPEALERQLKRDDAAGLLPAAIVVVHLYGQSSDMRAIMALADRYEIPVVEDAAESLGATYDNRPSGSHGRLSAFSFNGNKIITTSGGGALVADDEALIERARGLATQGRDQAEHYQHSKVAYNYRMSNILAGIGRGQMSHLQDRVAARRRVFKRYQEGFADVAGIRFQSDVAGGKGSRWLTVIDLDPDVIGIHPYQVMRRMMQAGIETRPAWKPMHMQPLCDGVHFEPHSTTEAVSPGLFLRSLCLPSGTAMVEATQDRIIQTLTRILEEG